MINKVDLSSIKLSVGTPTVVIQGMIAHQVIMLNNSVEGLFYFYHCLN